MRTILRIFAACALWVALWCAAIAAAWADQPPTALYERVMSTSIMVHQGRCKVDSMGITDSLCAIFADGARGLLWIVLFDDLELTDGLAATPQVSRIVLADGDSE